MSSLAELYISEIRLQAKEIAWLTLQRVSIALAEIRHKRDPIPKPVCAI